VAAVYNTSPWRLSKEEAGSLRAEVEERNRQRISVETLEGCIPILRTKKSRFFGLCRGSCFAFKP
jgi:hypothetical protein